MVNPFTNAPRLIFAWTAIAFSTREGKFNLSAGVTSWPSRRWSTRRLECDRLGRCRGKSVCSQPHSSMFLLNTEAATPIAENASLVFIVPRNTYNSDASVHGGDPKQKLQGKTPAQYLPPPQIRDAYYQEWIIDKLFVDYLLLVLQSCLLRRSCVLIENSWNNFARRPCF